MADTRTDPQTGLPNYEAMCEDLRRRLAEAHRYGTRLSLMLVKIDNLGDVFAHYGAEVGSVSLPACTRFVCAITREMDMVARFDVDVFGIILPCTPLIFAATAAERLRDTTSQSPVRLHGAELTFTVSVGVAESQKGDSLESLLQRAVDALTAATEAGGNAVRYHTGASVEALPTPAYAKAPQ